jgi:hypothetical protein
MKLKFYKANPETISPHRDPQLLQCEFAEAQFIEFRAPDLFGEHILRIKVIEGAKPAPVWKLSGGEHRASLLPSVLIKTVDAKGKEWISHFYVSRGRIRYLNDCTHKHAGHTLDMLEIDE